MSLKENPCLARKEKRDLMIQVVTSNEPVYYQLSGHKP